VGIGTLTDTTGSATAIKDIALNTRMNKSTIGCANQQNRNLKKRTGSDKLADNQKPWTPEENATLKKLLDEGLSKRQIATRMGRTYDSVNNKAKKIDTVTHSPMWTDEQVAILRENVGKLTSREIGAKVGRGKNAVLKKIEQLGLSGKKIGLQRGTQLAWTKHQLEQLKLRGPSMTVTQFSKEYGLTENQVRSKIRTEGIKMAPVVLWTSEQEEILRSSKCATEAAKRIGKSRKAVVNKAKKLGYKFPEQVHRETPIATRKPEKKALTNPRKTKEYKSTLVWCPTCHSPVSNWEEHHFRMSECKKVYLDSLRKVAA
jgi:hypothetical protein